MFKWEVMLKDGTLIKEGDWGRDIVSKVLFSEIFCVSLIPLKEFIKIINIYPEKGVIKIGETQINIGIDLGGYQYSLKEETKFIISLMAPINTASYCTNSGKNTVLDRHFVLEYIITDIKDKIIDKFEPIRTVKRTFCIKYTPENEICVS